MVYLSYKAMLVDCITLMDKFFILPFIVDGSFLCIFMKFRLFVGCSSSQMAG